jgi:hypothetical protein
VNGARLTAARALARGSAHPEEAHELAAAEPRLWRTVPACSGPVFTLAPDLQLHAADLTGLPAARLSPTQAKTLLAVLVVTSTGAAHHPFPGAAASVDDVLAVLGGPRIGLHGAAHVKGALNKLHLWRLAQLGPPGAERVVADSGVLVRVGPAVALWHGPWVSELMTLVGTVAEHRRPR